MERYLAIIEVGVSQQPSKVVFYYSASENR